MFLIMGMLMLFLFANANSQILRKMRYKQNKDSIKTVIKEFSDKTVKVPYEGKLTSLVVPHYTSRSAKQTVAAVKQIEGKKINTAVILCNSHRGFFKGLAVDACDEWESLFGTIPVDKELATKLVNGNDIIKFNSTPHRTDHTTELILPFLQQSISGEFKIVPILFGNSYYMGKDINNDYKVIAELLHKHLGPDDILIVSSDMTHFYPDKEHSMKLDKKQLELIEKGDVENYSRYEHLLASKDDSHKKIYNCARDGIKTALEVFHLAGGKGKIKVLDYGITGEDWNFEKYCGFSAIMIINN